MYQQIIAIFCLTIVSSSLCLDDVHNVMSTHDVVMTFRTSPNSVPEHEFVAIKNFPEATYSKVNGKRIVSSGGHMWIQAFGDNISLWLHPRDSNLIHEDTPVYYAKYSLGSPENVTFTKQHGVFERLGELFEDREYWASMIIGRDASGKTRVNGYIASKELTVRSLPDKVVKRYLRTRRSIDDSKYRSSDLSYHVVYRTPVDFNIKQSLVASNRTSFRAQLEQSGASGEIPYTLYPEILVVVENSLYTKIGRDRLLTYLIAFWNAVDLVYRSFENPRIRLHISGIIIGTVTEATPYISNNMVRRGIIDGEAAMNHSTTFFFNIKNSFPLDSYDIAVTMTRLQIGEAMNSGTYVGLSYIGTACLQDDEMKAGTILVHDNGVFDGYLVAAHELGHTFGMYHDDPEYVSGCLEQDGYIMASDVMYNRNSTSFSNCSLDSFEKQIYANNFTCLYNEPVQTDFGLPKLLPGKVKDRRDQCVANDYNRDCSDYDDDYCLMIRCIDWKGQCVKTNIAVLEGTPCVSSGSNMYCLRGRCTQIPEPSSEELQTMIAEANWTDWRKG